MVLLDLSLRNPEKTVQDVSGKKSYLCSLCKNLITSSENIFEVSGMGSRHHFVNSFGFDFNLITFIYCENVIGVSEAIAENTWFPPYAWVVLNCVICGDHLGWLYQNEDRDPKRFYGLIQEKLVLDLSGEA